MGWQRAEFVASCCAATIVVSGCGTSSSRSTRSAPAATSHAVSPAAVLSAVTGTDLGACASGNCEGTVRSGHRITVPARSQVRTLQVSAVGSGKVALSGQVIGNDSSTTCRNNCDITASNSDFQVSLGPDGIATVNKLTITVVAITGDTAVLWLATS